MSFGRTKVSKYNNVRTEIDGFKFASKKEAKRYVELKLLKESKRISYFLMQTPIHIPGAKYVCDFVVFDLEGKAIYEDVKGFKTDVYKLKKKMVEALYPIKIIEI